jgi:hypothetical protein
MPTTKPIVRPTNTANLMRRVVKWLLLIRKALKEAKSFDKPTDQKYHMRSIYDACVIALKDTAELSKQVSRMNSADLVELSNNFARERIAAPALMNEVIEHNYPVESQMKKLSDDERTDLFKDNELSVFVKSVKESLWNLERILKEYISGAVTYAFAVSAANKEIMITLGELAGFVARLRDFLKKFLSTKHKIEEPRYKLPQKRASNNLVFKNEEEALRYLANITGKKVLVP